MIERVVVRVPATVANLGPGFDAMGLALGWHDEIRVERGGSGLEITGSGLGAETMPRDERNDVVRGLRASLGELPPLRIHKTTAVAFARGFGASAISLVGGLLAGRALAEGAQTDEELVGLATGLEGHADNVAPCLLGGIVVAAGDARIRIDPPDGLRVLACVAAGGLSTEAARAALPDAVPHVDATRTAGRAALLAAALATGRFDALLDATEDLLHQPARFALMPDAAALVRGLREQNVAAFLSGAGPSVSALVPAADAEGAAARARDLAPEGWDIRVERIDPAGASVVEQR